MALEYGSKDLLRMEDIRNKSQGDWLKEMSLAKQMAELITQPGKSQARAYAAQEVFGKLSPHAYIFFERAYELGGDNVYAEASIDQIEDADSAFAGIPEANLPATRRRCLETLSKKKRSLKPIPIQSMGKVSLVKGTGPEFSVHIFNTGILEVWKDPKAKLPKLIWTAANEPNFGIGEKSSFFYDDKRHEWTMVDYIDTLDIANLIPLYGKNLPIYSYN